MNLALRRIKSDSKLDVIVVHNADVFPKKNMLKNLLKPFEDYSVGMTCIKPVSLNDSEKFVGFLNNLIWSLHHLISLESTKVGEVFAYRNVIKNTKRRRCVFQLQIAYSKNLYSILVFYYFPDFFQHCIESHKNYLTN